MSSVSRSTAKQVVDELRDAVNAVYAKYGLEAPTVKSVYGDYLQVTFKGAPMTAGANGVNLTSVEATNWAYYCDQYGLTADALGVKFVVQDKVFVFTGYVPSRPKFPFSGRGMDGKSYKFGTSVVPAIRRGVAVANLDKLTAAAADKAV